MLDIKVIRENPDSLTEALKKRGLEENFKEILKKDEERRKYLHEVEELKHERNSASQKIGLLKKEGKSTDEETSRMKDVGQRIKNLDEKVKKVTDSLEWDLLNIPNAPDSSVPSGATEDDNVEIKKWGEPKNFDFLPLSHRDLGEKLGILDFGRGAKITGSGFTLYKGLGARMERALIQMMLDIHTEEHGYEEVSPPFLVNRDSALSTGNLPKFEEDLYRIEEGPLYLIPTAEVPVTNIYRDEILPEKSLPIKYASYTPCFRQEAGSWGKDTAGLIRQHQFNKVELVKFVHPDRSPEELELLLDNAEEILRRLELPYRVVQLCGGDLGFSSAKTYDIEVWIPSQNKYREISSCSNFKDFQARRGNIRFRPEKGKPSLLHTINGSGLAIGRTLVAILENCQEKDGTVTIPEKLRPYMGNVETIK